MFRNTIPETPKPGCLCKGMKTHISDHRYPASRVMVASRRLDRTVGQTIIDSMVTQVDKNGEILGALTSGGAVVAAELAGLGHRMNASVDFFLDEAGQLSLANVLAASRHSFAVLLACISQGFCLAWQGLSPELYLRLGGCRLGEQCSRMEPF